MQKESIPTRVEKEIASLTRIIGNMVDDFKKVTDPLLESHRQVPEATSQLERINEQTEAATHQVMDSVEIITERENEIISGLEEIKQKAQSSSPELIGALVDALSLKANANVEDAYVIIESLQFQDITAQQMARAATMLEDIEDKLRNILTSICDEEDLDELLKRRVVRKDRAFDSTVGSHPDFSGEKANQEDIDSLFDQSRK